MTRKFGFVVDGSTDHLRLALWASGSMRVLMKVPNVHSRQDLIGDDLLARIARECGVKLAYFKQMIGCQRSRQDYYAQMDIPPDSTE